MSDTDTSGRDWTWWVPETGVVLMGVATVFYYSPESGLTFLLGGGLMLTLTNMFGFDRRYHDTDSDSTKQTDKQRNASGDTHE